MCRCAVLFLTLTKQQKNTYCYFWKTNKVLPYNIPKSESSNSLSALAKSISSSLLSNLEQEKLDGLNTIVCEAGTRSTNKIASFSAT